ncbi:TetR/AcrR family transcriptional regulator [Methylovirgula sp. 4M-Z18]|uniref:TetR/AcrR family transcriptional regulator n=1 Tax=Methylovirgula sp. 4M-Z18 TaxID=2293567 RepID=UPI000E2F4A25|nr:TetR/AcrR family transcriptional regulator [Methylovirgula sp. 4M-Z18]RFB75543.1 TetR/AcrR family transcriptional regulator [Methylovirgula sp. 4M-Z18]
MSEARASKRAALVSAAKDLLWERGYEATSPRDILERAGAGQGSLYHHFPGKLELALAALEEMKAEESAAMDALFAPDKPPLQRIDDYLARERDALRGCRLARLSGERMMENPRFRQAIADYLERIEAHLRTALGEAQARGEIQAGLDPSHLAAMLLAVVEGGFVMARTHWDASRMARALEGAWEIIALAVKTRHIGR